MAILNIGSINWDRIYYVQRFPAPGETLTALRAEIGLGGKGLNHSVAIHRSGGRVIHLGPIGRDDTEMRARMAAFGLTTDSIVGVGDVQTGSALIVVDGNGENQIVLDPGANRRIPLDAMTAAIDRLVPGQDWLLMQNETNGLAEAVAHAKSRNVQVALAAAPFEAASVLPVLENLDLLAVNAVEYDQLCGEIGGPSALPAGLSLFVTRGSQGAELRANGATLAASAPRVQAVDTTGAGDTAFGAFMARLDLGEPQEQSLRFAMAAAALQVTRPGAAIAIPEEADVMKFLHEGQR